MENQFGEYDVVDYVIGNLEDEVYKELEKGIEKAAEATVDYLQNGIDIAMNEYN